MAELDRRANTGQRFHDTRVDGLVGDCEQPPATPTAGDVNAPLSDNVCQQVTAPAQPPVPVPSTRSSVSTLLASAFAPGGYGWIFPLLDVIVLGLVAFCRLKAHGDQA